MGPRCAQSSSIAALKPAGVSPIEDGQSQNVLYPRMGYLDPDKIESLSFQNKGEAMNRLSPKLAT